MIKYKRRGAGRGTRIPIPFRRIFVISGTVPVSNIMGQSFEELLGLECFSKRIS
jgi:hypothetical protein